MNSWRKRLPHPALVFVVLAWGLNFSIIKIAYREIPPAAVGLVRYLCMLPLLAVWCCLIKEKLSYPKGQFWKITAAGFMGSGAYMVLFLEGMRTAPPAMASIALATSPIMTAALSVILKHEKYSARLLVGSLVAFAGVGLSVVGSEARTTGSATGTLLIVCSALLWSISLLQYRAILTEMSGVRALALSFPGAALVLVPYGIGAVSTAKWQSVSGLGIAAMVYLILVAGLGAFAAYYKGVSDVGPTKATMTQYFVPPVASIFAVFVLHDHLTPGEILGLVVVIAGVALANWKPVKKSE